RGAQGRRARARAAESAASEAALRELQRVFHEEVDRLPARYRAPFILFCLEGRTRAEAAAELGINQNTLSSRLAAARARLRQALARRGGSLSAALGLYALRRGGPAQAAGARGPQARPRNLPPPVGRP